MAMLAPGLMTGGRLMLVLRVSREIAPLLSVMVRVMVVTLAGIIANVCRPVALPPLHDQTAARVSLALASEERPPLRKSRTGCPSKLVAEMSVPALAMGSALAVSKGAFLSKMRMTPLTESESTIRPPENSVQRRRLPPNMPVIGSWRWVTVAVAQFAEMASFW